jgi:molybdopterin molybdotransferase
VRPAVESAGGAIDFWKIRMRPGKPLIAGTIGNAVLLGLPGNPVSAFVTATLFLAPLIRYMLGYPDPRPVFVTRPLAVPLGSGAERDDYMRATLAQDGSVTPIPRQDSAHLAALCRADCLLLRPAGVPPAQAGDPVSVILLD